MESKACILTLGSYQKMPVLVQKITCDICWLANTIVCMWDQYIYNHHMRNCICLTSIDITQHLILCENSYRYLNNPWTIVPPLDKITSLINVILIDTTNPWQEKCTLPYVPTYRPVWNEILNSSKWIHWDCWYLQFSAVLCNDVEI